MYPQEQVFLRVLVAAETRVAPREMIRIMKDLKIILRWLVGWSVRLGSSRSIPEQGRSWWFRLTSEFGEGYTLAIFLGAFITLPLLAGAKGLGTGSRDLCNMLH